VTLTTSTSSAEAPSQEEMLVRFDGRRILDCDGATLAEIAADGCWYTSGGEKCEGLIVPAPRAQPKVAPAERDAARRAIDGEWMVLAVEAIRRLAATTQTITGDDVWAALEMPPRESRMIGNALQRARGLGLIEPTEEHRRSQRKYHNHARLVRVWRCLRTPQQQLS
jgi:hypothetical protein